MKSHDNQSYLWQSLHNHSVNIFHNYIFRSIPFSCIKFAVIVKRKRLGQVSFDCICNCFFDLELFWSACTSWPVEVWSCSLWWLRWILQYRCNTDCPAQQWIVWIVMDSIHNMFSFTSVKTVNTTTNKILLTMSSTSQCPVKHTG